MADFAAGLLIALTFCFAVRHIYKNAVSDKKDCCGSCTSCNGCHAGYDVLKK